MNLKFIKPVLLAFAMGIWVSCSELFEYSPFEAKVNSSNNNSNNIEEISQTTFNNDTLKFVVFSDSHSYYDELLDAVKSINKQGNIQFVVCCGDVTESGLAQEYTWYNDISKKIRYPLITTIGNHDYLSNGSIIYSQMFGPTNFSFTKGSYKFVIFNDIVWENSNKSPDFDWLENELDTTSIPKCILITHIPPWTDQLEGKNCDVYKNIVTHKNVMLSLFGHLHDYEEGNFNSVPFIITGSVLNRAYTIISLYHNQFSYKRIAF
jgi:3',5'-cyclic-AMP phosphodiesterase